MDYGRFKGIPSVARIDLLISYLFQDDSEYIFIYTCVYMSSLLYK